MTIVSFMDKKVILTYLITYSSMTKMIASFDENWKIIFRSQRNWKLKNDIFNLVLTTLSLIFVEFVSYCDTDNILSHFCFFIYVLVFQGPAGPPGPAMSFYRAQRDSSVCVYLDLVESMTDLQYH